jgi:hypothetical protein
MRKLKVLYHDRCFDGLSSAAIFSKFYREKIHADTEISYQGLAHSSGGSIFPPDSFSGDDNVVVDFRYSADPKLTWWFDHHQSAFPTPEDRAAFEADRSGQKFYDPKAKSCARFLCRTVVERFGFDAKPLDELVHWAEIIDGAMFPDAKTAVELKEPALQLMVAIEGSQDEAARHRLIGDMQTLSLAELVALPYVQGPLQPLLEAHRKTVEIMRREVKCERGVASFDLTAHGLETFNKFIAYYLYPDATYTVGVTAGPSRAKVSVGSDPWHPERRKHDLSKICERYGGGGHAVVAAISFPPGETERARKAAKEIVEELQGQKKTLPG